MYCWLGRNSLGLCGGAGSNRNVDAPPVVDDVDEPASPGVTNRAAHTFEDVDDVDVDDDNGAAPSLRVGAVVDAAAVAFVPRRNHERPTRFRRW